uniref:Uncharacterized protein n=1 Tax=Arundo donax TaxID=35708 RepID=A0A0A9AQX5_ARUDO
MARQHGNRKAVGAGHDLLTGSTCHAKAPCRHEHRAV